MTLSEKITALLVAAVGGGGFGVMVKSFFDQRKTGAEAHKADADAGKSEAEGGAITIEALRKLVLDLLTQVSTLNGQYTTLNNANAILALRNAELDVQLAVLQEVNRKLTIENEAGRSERHSMQQEIYSLQDHVRRLEKGVQDSMGNIPAIVVLLLIAAGIVAAMKYGQHRQQLRLTIRTDEELKGYRDFLMQSPDNELSAENAAFVQTLLTAALTGEHTRRLRPIDRARRRLDNEIYRRAIGLAQISRWQIANPNTEIQKMPPELRAIAEAERCFAAEPKPQSSPKVSQ